MPELLPGYAWNPKLGRYVQLKPYRMVSRRKINDLLEQQIEARLRELTRYTEALLEGKIAPSIWLEAMKLELKRIHLQSAALGAGGWDRLTQSHYGRVGNILRNDYRRLENFLRDIAQGRYTKEDGQLDAKAIFRRVEAYTGNVRKEYYINRATPKPSANEILIQRRILGASEHCDDCVVYYEMGWQPYGVLPPPCVNSACGPFCKCEIEDKLIPVTEKDSYIGTKR